MKDFLHYRPASVDEACELLATYRGRAKLNGGGSDLVTVLRGSILEEYPEAIIDLKNIRALSYIHEEADGLHVGAATTLSEIEKNALVREQYPALGQAARAVASPQIRNVGTLAGNLCQDIRCWYYRYPDRLGGGALPCARKGEKGCLAVRGDNRYHAIMGAKGCFGVCPSDTAVALCALNAQLCIIRSGARRWLPVSEFYGYLGNVLADDELVREIMIPASSRGLPQHFVKFAQRKAIDFAIASAAACYRLEDGKCRDVRVFMGAVAPMPFRAAEAEAVLEGQLLTPQLTEKAADAAVSQARPLRDNSYKIDIAKTMVYRAVLPAGE